MFGANVFVDVVRRYGLTQEYITPHSPEQNGMIERLSRSLKEECLWHHQFMSWDHAVLVIATRLEKYRTERPHSASAISHRRSFPSG